MIADMRKYLTILAIALATTPTLGQEVRQVFIDDVARVRIVTTVGDIVVELNAERAPMTVENFLQYVVDDHYTGTVFHRVAAGFIVQGGGYLPDLTLKPVVRQVFNESGNGLSNLRGTIAMARGNDPHAADSQFYFNLVNNTDLNPRPTRWGYAVFGEVVEGMEVVDQIGAMPTGAAGEFDRDVPVQTVVIEQIELIRE